MACSPKDNRTRRLPVVAAGKIDPPECLDCGVCCFSTLPRYVPVTGDDYERLGEDAAAMVVWEENKAYLRLEDGHCAALRIGTRERRFVCSVYDRRPTTCRALERGSPECAGERATKGERPRSAVLRTEDERERDKD
jgi:Fe-S-cluster containining protein